MKILIIILSIISYNADAMRCGTQVVTEGDSLREVVEACRNPDGGYSNVEFTAPDKLYYEQSGGRTCTVTQSNGTVNNIECNR